MNASLAVNVIEEALQYGVTEFCLCPGARMGPLYRVLMNAPSIAKYFWPEERSAAFFALGRARASNRPVAVITTSGTAAGELLPAAMEAYYSGVPLLLITADRPRRFRGSGAPQTAEQAGLFGVYAPFALDLEGNEACDLAAWHGNAPAHLNVCFEEPFSAGENLAAYMPRLMALQTATRRVHVYETTAKDELDQFLESVHYPMVVVGSLPASAREATIEFLVRLNAPVFLEGISGLREEERLQHLRIARTDGLLSSALKANYALDGILRIGGVPTFRLWRDIEEKNGQIKALSINHVPFSGLSWGAIIQTDLNTFLNECKDLKNYSGQISKKWLENDKKFTQQLEQLMREEPLAETSLMHRLSEIISSNALVYLGNSLPIREWDLAASNSRKHFNVLASRGVNGIDGQLSTFLGLCHPGKENWAIIGDLTALYDLAAPWIMEQLPEKIHFNIVIINNGGGQIFNRFLKDAHFLNVHKLNFKPLAQMWGLEYELWRSIEKTPNSARCLIEIVPDGEASNRLNLKLSQL